MRAEPPVDEHAVQVMLFHQWQVVLNVVHVM